MVQTKGGMGMEYRLAIYQQFKEEGKPSIEEKHATSTLYDALMWFSDETTRLGITEDRIEVGVLNQWVDVEEPVSYRYMLELHVKNPLGEYVPFKTLNG